MGCGGFVSVLEVFWRCCQCSFGLVDVVGPSISSVLSRKMLSVKVARLAPADSVRCLPSVFVCLRRCGCARLYLGLQSGGESRGCFAAGKSGSGRLCRQTGLWPVFCRFSRHKYTRPNKLLVVSALWGQLNSVYCPNAPRRPIASTHCKRCFGIWGQDTVAKATAKTIDKSIGTAAVTNSHQHSLDLLVFFFTLRFYPSFSPFLVASRFALFAFAFAFLRLAPFVLSFPPPLPKQQQFQIRGTPIKRATVAKSVKRTGPGRQRAVV